MSDVQRMSTSPALSFSLEQRRLLKTIVDELRARRFLFGDEQGLQDGIAELLHQQGLGFSREHRIGSDRFDFFVTGGLVIEVKVDGSLHAAAEQARRYCKHDSVAGVIVAAATRWADTESLTGGGKPIHFVKIQRVSF